HRIGERDLVPIERRLSGRDLDLGAEILALKQPARAVDPPRARQLHDAAGGVAAGLDLAAVAVPDPHPEFRSVAWLEHDQLVAADARAPIGDGARERRRDAE